MSDEDVREATEALKGMLGIGIGIGGGAASPPPAPETSPAPVTSAVAGAATHDKEGKKTKKKRTKKVKNEGVGNKNREGKKGGKKEAGKGGREDNNFAWSAFQSSPDASALPIPTFASSSSILDTPDASKDKVPDKEEMERLPAILRGSTGPSIQKDDSILQSMKTAHDLEEEVLASLKPHTPLTPQHKEEQKEVLEKLEDTASGINLAAFASADTHSPAHTPRQYQTPPGHFFHQHQQYPYHPHPHHLPASPHHYPPHPFSNHSPQHPTADITLPIQLPPVIPPNRHIMVPTPSGYIPVHVPENYSPGMIMPLTLPAHTMAPRQHIHHAQSPPPPINTPNTWASKVASSPKSKQPQSHSH